VLPAFATVLKIRAKKLTQTSGSQADDVIVNSNNSSVSSFLSFDHLVVKLNVISDIQNYFSSYSDIYINSTIKNETLLRYKFNLLNRFNILTLFI